MDARLGAGLGLVGVGVPANSAVIRRYVGEFLGDLMLRKHAKSLFFITSYKYYGGGNATGI